MQDQVTARNQNQKLVFLHCNIDHKVLRKSVLKISNVTDMMIKIVNFIRARALNHRYFAGLSEDHS